MICSCCARQAAHHQRLQQGVPQYKKLLPCAATCLWRPLLSTKAAAGKEASLQSRTPGGPILQVEVYRNRFVVAFTAASLLLLDWTSDQLCELPWQRTSCERFCFDYGEVRPDQLWLQQCLVCSSLGGVQGLLVTLSQDPDSLPFLLHPHDVASMSAGTEQIHTWCCSGAESAYNMSQGSM